MTSWRDLLWPSEPRLSEMRAQIAALQVDLAPPVYRYRVPDGRERMQGKATLTRWERYQAAAKARLRDERRRA